MNTISQNILKVRRKGGTLKDAFTNEAGVVDLASIVIGVVVMAIIALGALATVTMVIPFAQDKGAQADLAAVATAQGVYYSMSADEDGIAAGQTSYATLKQLQGVPTGEALITSADGIKVDLIDDGEGWTAQVTSGSGTVYSASSELPTPFKGTLAEASAAAATVAP